jgi:hypothetical protein
MVLLGDMGHVESCFGLFEDTNNLDARGARFALNVPWAQKSLWMHQMEHLGDLGHVESHFGPFGDNVSAGAR